MKLHPSEFFRRQAAVRDIGAEGIEKLHRSRVAVVGVGGVGSAAVLCLAKSGVGYVRLIDQDIVEPSNLHRLSGAGEENLYKPKAEVLAEVASRSSPSVQADAVVETLRPSNARDLLVGVDLVVDCLDNFRTRYVVNEFCVENRVPFIFTSAVANQAHVGGFNPPKTGCLACLMPGVIDGPQDSCEVLGVTTAIVDVVGAIAAGEALKLLVGNSSKLVGHLLTVDLAAPDFILARIPKAASCPVCSTQASHPKIMEASLSLLCGGRTASVIPEVPVVLDLEAVSKTVKGQVLMLSDTVLVYSWGEMLVSLFRNGRLLLDGVGGEEDARRAAGEVWMEVSGV